jgi:hypothetical protein
MRKHVAVTRITHRDMAYCWMARLAKRDTLTAHAIGASVDDGLAGMRSADDG